MNTTLFEYERIFSVGSDNHDGTNNEYDEEDVVDDITDRNIGKGFDRKRKKRHI